MQTPIATVVIPNYNGLRFLPRLMESLHAQRDGGLTITVVDDASPDESVAYLRKNWPHVQLICNEKNLGFAGTCNVGLRAATTPFVALLNNDTHVEIDWMAEGLRPFERSDVGAVASLVLLFEPPHLVDTAGDVYSVVGGAVKRNHLRPRESVAGLNSACFSPCGASAFFRREALERVGLLDERFESYYEDVELGFRLAWAGYRCVFARKSVCYHHLSASYHPRGWRYHFNSARNAEIVWWAHVPRRLRRKHFIGHFSFLAMQAVNKLRQGCLRPWLAGKWAALRRREEIRGKRAEIASLARVDESVIKNILVQDWWSLHVKSRFRQPAGGGQHE